MERGEERGTVRPRQQKNLELVLAAGFLSLDA
jgi:hypothetical protein